MKVTAIIVAAGSSKRMGLKVNKPYLLINGFPVLYHSIKAFKESKITNEIIVVIRKEDIKLLKKIIKDYGLKGIKYVKGGKERQDSVLNGLSQVKNKNNIILIHDAARPFISQSLIIKIAKAANLNGAAIPVVNVKDTVKYSKDERSVFTTIDRNKLFLAQTPQGFKYETIMFSNKKAKEEKWDATDDSMLVELAGRKVVLIQGDENNSKITVPSDIIPEKNDK